MAKGNFIANMVSAVVDSFVELALGGIILAVVFGLSIASNSSLVSSLQTKINDGMTTVGGLVVLAAIIVVVAIVKRR